ncbi:MAG TPA: phospholipid-binding protein, partial [Burkholderiales bacterium]|nr:phospholipid-binding protein [Burkholderiales bacterium]
MRLTSTSFSNNRKIPAEFAFCAPDPKTHVTLSKNLNPHLAWYDVPPNTKSLALICHDPDVP